MKRTLIVSVFSLLGLTYFVPGEFWVQFGLRKIAIEQGIAAASRHHSWEAAADADAAVRVAQSQPAPTAKAKAARR
jgi:hypothetical protein